MGGREGGGGTPLVLGTHCRRGKTRAGGGGYLLQSLCTHCEKDPEGGGGDKEKENRGDSPIPLNSRAVGHL